MFLSCLLALAITVQTPPKLYIGLSPNVPANNNTPSALSKVIREEVAMGINMLQYSRKWNDLEPEQGETGYAKLKTDLANGTSMGLTPLLTWQTIDTNQRTVPEDLRHEAWDSPKMLAREEKSLQALIPTLPREVVALSLGNEVDNYLAAHPDEVAAYHRFLINGRNIIRKMRPSLHVGVTTTFSGIAQSSRLIAQIQDGMDVVVMTYYPLNPDMTVQPITEITKQFTDMLRVAYPRLLVLQEIGYPASPICKSSETMQAYFITNVFRMMKDYPSLILAANFFLISDFSDDFVNKLIDYYGFDDPKFRAFLSSIGLKDQYGNQREAYKVFKSRINEFVPLPRMELR